jgi:hypothetical protein
MFSVVLTVHHRDAAQLPLSQRIYKDKGEQQSAARVGPGPSNTKRKERKKKNSRKRARKTLSAICAVFYSTNTPRHPQHTHTRRKNKVLEHTGGQEEQQAC